MIDRILFLSLALLSTIPGFSQQDRPAVPLTIGETRILHSTLLDEDRTLNIFLPASYDPARSYPVLYLLDGSMNEDFLHVAGLIQFYQLQFAMPEVILIGIANVDRKRVALSTLALMGVPPGRLVGFPVVQAVAIAGLGFALAVAAFALAQAAINATFAAPGLAGQPVSVLHGSQIALAGLATGVAALAPSLIAGWRAARVEPAEGIRDV